MKTPKLLILAAGLLMFVACDYDNESDVANDYNTSDVAYEAEAEEAATEDFKAEESQSTYRKEGSYVELKNGIARFTDNDVKQANKPVMRTNDKIIKKGSVGVKVKDFDKQKHFFEDLIRKFDGYKSNENERREVSRVSNTIEIRLPNQNFDQFIEAISISDGVMHVDYKRTSAVDVGEEYYDLMTRIKTKKEVEKRYIEILRKANKITDILAVEDQIRVIREEIESKEGRLRFLKDRISLSTISLYVYQELEYDAPLVDKPTFWGKVAKAAFTGWNMILSFLLFLVYIWPIVLIFIFTIVAYKKKWLIFKNRK